MRFLSRLATTTARYGTVRHVRYARQAPKCDFLSRVATTTARYSVVRHVRYATQAPKSVFLSRLGTVLSHRRRYGTYGTLGKRRKVFFVATRYSTVAQETVQYCRTGGPQWTVRGPWEDRGRTVGAWLGIPRIKRPDPKYPRSIRIHPA